MAIKESLVDLFQQLCFRLVRLFVCVILCLKQSSKPVQFDKIQGLQPLIGDDSQQPLELGLVAVLYIRRVQMLYSLSLVSFAFIKIVIHCYCSITATKEPAAHMRYIVGSSGTIVIVQICRGVTCVTLI